jgi:hypothetical protein
MDNYMQVKIFGFEIIPFLIKYPGLFLKYKVAQNMGQK